MSEAPTAEAIGQEPHAMSLQRSFPTGAAEWRCARCGRWTIVALPQGPGRLKIVVLAPGNEHVVHHCSAEGVGIPAVQASGRAADSPASEAASPGDGGGRTLH